MSTPTLDGFEPPVAMGPHEAQDAYFGAISPTGGDTVLMQQGMKSAYEPPQGGPGLTGSSFSFKPETPKL